MIQLFLRDEHGATAIEYALMAGMISLAIITAVGLLGAEMQATFQDTATKVAEAGN